MNKLRDILKRIDGKGYKAYKDIRGQYSFHDFSLHLDYIQGDPFASPSKIRLEVPKSRTILKQDWESTDTRKIRIEDTVARSVANAIRHIDARAGGSGKSGVISIDRPAQEVLQRTAVQLTEKSVIICLSVGLPAQGRKVLGKQAEKMLLTIIPQILQDSIFSMKEKTLVEAVELCDQQDAIRDYMKENNLITFIGNGSVLPRESGISDRPLKSRDVVAFEAPQSLTISIPVPHRQEPLKGMGIQKGITLIVGGGYHGKSTVLEAVERGVYNHISGDGREFVLTDPQAMKIRSEDGRKITNVDISPFIQNLPFGKATKNFTSEDASGSTSQAATIIESLEARASTLLIDEDTSATNFMIRDERMQQLVAKEKEPITPFIDKVKQLHEEHDVSTVLVMGGSGDYFDVADTVILMDQYRPWDVTCEAKDIARKSKTHREREGGNLFGTIQTRKPQVSSLDSRKGKRSKVAARGLHTIQYGTTDLKLDFVEQLVDASQTRAIAEIIHFIEKNKWLGSLSIDELLDRVILQLNEKGLASFTEFPNQHPGDLARPRMLELASALNRLRTLKIEQ
ncbi:ABC-ATPase domain-containing protein [Pseudalkalibacillus berkeleyi]|uniref:ABC-ATPase domain-containing protein n=1 Tax=Pseudalkalibacillus berkeleyi TaxID=1069813 RepID=A0ABS9GTD6_9BACL|nr:ABC-ATPase domain-containing protein [Pseudalkalibacillus berkeleyi]MCF6136108.1 ABC-ATPase domain-containing protein [Pseudalkalibacillus berkeleyi]